METQYHLSGAYIGSTPLGVGSVSMRDQIEADILTDPRLDVPMETIHRRLDRCFAGCEHFRHGRCKKGNVKSCEQYQRWVERVIDGECVLTKEKK